MFNPALRFFLTSLLLLLPALSQAVVIEAEGQALIRNGDIVSAREAAVRDASQQASMQAAVYVSSNQVVRDGILEIDNMQISTLGKVSNIDILDEKVVGTQLFVRIKADVLIDEGCSNGVTNRYVKSVAFTAFPLLKLDQANLGGFYSISSDLPAMLAQQATQDSALISYNAGRLNLHSDPSQATTSQLDDGALTSMLSSVGQLNVNYVVSGVIRDISMVDPRTHSEDNYFIDLYNRLDYKSKKHLRNFSLDLFIHDGTSGELISQKHYQTAGLWNLDRTISTGFGTPGFSKQDYGQKVQQLQQQIMSDITEQLRCEPFSSAISRTEDRYLWINAGRQQGLKPGDRLTVYRRNTFFSPDMKAHTQLINTRQTLVIDDVQTGFASGYLNSPAATHNIRTGDLVIAR